MSWHEARTDCWMEVGTEGKHGDLISLHTEQEANLIASKTSQDGLQNFWTGLARGGDGSFSWVDGTPYDLEWWLDGEPNCYEGCGEDCVEAYHVDARWNDAYCYDQKASICMTDKRRESHYIKQIQEPICLLKFKDLQLQQGPQQELQQ